MKYSLIILLVFSLPAFGTNYYVKTAGNNSNTGQSDAQAWATIAKINSSTFNPGDSIFFNCGDTWRETLEVPSDGSAEVNLYFGKYGTGANPRILGSKATTTWTNQGSNVWKTDITFTNPRSLYPNYADIVFNESGTERFGIYQSTTASLNAAYEWTWSSNYIYVYSTSDPASAYTGIEVQQRQFCISTNDNPYLHFDGIDVGYSANAGYDSNNDHTVSDQHGCIIENCEIGFIGGVTGQQFGFGTAIAYSNLTIRNNDIHHCGRRGISINMEYNASPYTVHDILIEDNEFHHGSHTTSLDMTVNNGGSSSSIDGVIFRRNLVYEENGASVNYTSCQIWFQAYSGTGTMDNIQIYSNVFKYWRENAFNSECRTIKNVYIYNNTFYENNTAGTNLGYSYTVYSDYDNTNLRVYVKNNVFYTTLNHDKQGSGAHVVIYGLNSTHYICDYNLFYRINNTVRTHLINGTSYYMNTITNLPNNWEDNSPTPGNPLFVSTADLHLQDESPAVGTGVDLNVTYDIEGTPFDADNPSIGAYEHGGVDSTLTDILTFTLEEQTGSATINTTNHTVSIETAYGTDVTGLTPTITMDYGATINPTSGSSQNFTNPVTYTVTALDGETTQEWVVTVTVDDLPPVVPTVSTTEVTSIGNTTATSGGNVTSDGGGTVSTRGVCWNTATNPTTANDSTKNGTGTGEFTSSLTGLTAGTTYYVRAYAINETGTAYGDNQIFTTKDSADVTTGDAWSIKSRTVRVYVDVTDDHGADVTEKGICWARTTYPTVSNNKVVASTDGIGLYNLTIEGLQANTTYYYRAYATNSVGTSYGAQKTFTTVGRTYTKSGAKPAVMNGKLIYFK